MKLDLIMEGDQFHYMPGFGNKKTR